MKTVYIPYKLLKTLLALIFLYKTFMHKKELERLAKDLAVGDNFPTPLFQVSSHRVLRKDIFHPKGQSNNA